MGGAAGESSGAGGAGDREATPDEICRAYCPSDAYHILDIVRYYCGEPGGASADSGEGGAGGSGGYDPEACYQYCLGSEEVNVAPVCGDESMLYMTCQLDFGNWVCLEGGGGLAVLCSPLFEMLRYCILANPVSTRG
jgi:hypothetical protein